MRREGLLDSGHDRRIPPCTDWRREVNEHLHELRLILPFLRADFVASHLTSRFKRRSTLGKKSDQREQRIAAAKAREAALNHEVETAGTLSHFQRIIKALTMVAPIGLVLRYEDGLNHCIEASICAAEALARRQIAARVVLCAAVAVHRKRQELRIPIGLSPRQIYDRINWGDVPVLPYETWKAQQTKQLPRDDLNTHAVIEANFGGESALIDLTIGQLRESPEAEAKTIPWQVVVSGEWWPQFESPDWIIAYADSPHSPEVRAPVEAMIREFKNPAFVTDLDDAIGLALQCDLDEGRFHAELKRQHPTEFATAMSRIAQFGGHG